MTGRIDAFSPNSKKVHIDIDPRRSTRSSGSTRSIADCAAALDALIAALKLRTGKAGPQARKRKSTLARAHGAVFAS
ncbi:MAG: hypothetical protein R3C00_03565 [Hyphomonas sp.]